MIKSTDGATYTAQTFSSLGIDESGIAVYFCENTLFSYLRAERILEDRGKDLWKISYIC